MKNRKVKGGNKYMNMNFEEINKLFSILHKWKTVGVSEETITLVNKEFRLYAAKYYRNGLWWSNCNII